ncbi:hypothetical protein K439DRAFT_1230012, partial [Ramaria rubella]
ESSMKRWTDGYPWSPSRIQHEFLVSEAMFRLLTQSVLTLTYCSYTEKYLVRLSTSGCARVDDVFNRGGLMKKTFSLSVNNETWHLVSYYTLEDVLASCLPTPKENSFFSGMTISEDVLEH